MIRFTLSLLAIAAAFLSVVAIAHSAPPIESQLVQRMDRGAVATCLRRAEMREAVGLPAHRDRCVRRVLIRRGVGIRP